MLEGDNDNHSSIVVHVKSLYWEQVCCEENDPANIKYSTVGQLKSKKKSNA